MGYKGPSDFAYSSYHQFTQLPSLLTMAPNNSGISTRGQRVVVAGASGGIGLGVALAFAKSGAEVWIVGRNPKTGKFSTILVSLFKFL